MTVLQKTVLENSDFTCIKAERSWQIEIVQDEKCFVELEYSAYLESYLKCAAANRVLEIGFTASGNLASGTVNKAKVHIVDFESLELTGACKVSVNGSFGKVSALCSTRNLHASVVRFFRAATFRSKVLPQ